MPEAPWRWFSPSRMPVMVRTTYRRELLTTCTLPIAVSLFEGGVFGVLAKRVFGVSDLAFATILAVPFFANATSLLWTRLARGRPKVPFISLLMGLIVGGTAGLALLPTPEPDAAGRLVASFALEWLVVAYVMGVRSLIAGMITLRSQVWRNNYRRALRGRVTSRLIMLAALILGTAPTLLYRLLDGDPQRFRLIYPVAAALAIVGVWSFSRVRLRGEQALLKYERDGDPTPPSRSTPPASPTSHEPSTPARRVGALTILRQDRLFRSYMILQFIMGLGNLMAEAAVIKLTIDLISAANGSSPGSNNFSFGLATLLTVTLPFVCAGLTLPLWARYLDRVHILEFRSRHAVLFAVIQIIYSLAAATGLLALLALGRVVQGIARGGGMLAWQLGHNDFTDRRLAAVYMGVHVTLTGIRGLVAPFLAIALLEGVSTWPGVGSTLSKLADLAGDNPLGHAFTAAAQWTGLGAGLFILTGVMLTAAWLGFVRLHLRHARQHAKPDPS
ncbi:MAG: hypothetical protein AAF797_15830 [Planctomycetota bacterium]